MSLFDVGQLERVELTFFFLQDYKYRHLQDSRACQHRYPVCGLGHGSSLYRLGSSPGASGPACPDSQLAVEEYSVCGDMRRHSRLVCSAQQSGAVFQFIASFSPLPSSCILSLLSRSTLLTWHATVSNKYSSFLLLKRRCGCFPASWWV